MKFFAYAHDEFQKLSGQLLLDVANRLPGTLKRRYLDYLVRWNLDLNRPGFDSLRDFISHELSVMSSDYAQTFFRSEDKDKPRDSGYGRASVHVRQVAVKSQDRPLKESATKTGSGIVKSRGPKVPPLCFVCDDATSRHFLGSCTKFINLSMDDKKQIVINANRCLNCSAKGHFAQKCSLICKCTVCGANNVHKHATALHDVFGGITPAELGAAGVESVCETGSSTENVSGENPIQPSVKKLSSTLNGVLLRTSAVKVINPINGKSALAYAQHDAGSQVTLVSDRLKNELGLDVRDELVVIRTLADQTTKSGGFTHFDLQSLVDDRVYHVHDAQIVPDFAEESACLPHAVKVAHFKHFLGVNIPTILDRNKTDILIGQSDKELLVVLDEREGSNPEEPNFVLTRLRPIASGGTAGENQFMTRRALVADKQATCECERLRVEVSNLKEVLRRQELEDEIIQPSKSEELARKLVEPNVKLVDGRYEIRVPLKSDIVNNLTNNFHSAVDRTATLRKKSS